MKKFTAIFLALIMAFSLTACGGGKEEKSDKTEVKTDKKEDSKKEKKEDKRDEEPFDEITIVDDDWITIAITGVEPEGSLGYTLDLYLENNSEDYSITFATDAASVDGLNVTASLYTSLDPGKKSNEELVLDSEVLSEYGLEDPTDIAIKFNVYDSEEYTEIYNEIIDIYPYGEDEAEYYERKEKKTDDVILDNDYAKITVIGVSYDEFWGTSLDLYLENKTDSFVMFGVDDVYVNGYSIDPFYADSVLPYSCKYSSMSWDTDELEASGIVDPEDIEDIEFGVRVYDYDDWSLDNFVEETVYYVQ